MNVICLPDRALAGGFGTGIAGLSLLSRNICTATPSPEALVGLIPLASVPIFRRSMTYGRKQNPMTISISGRQPSLSHNDFCLAEKEGEVLLGSHHRAFPRFPREAATRGGKSIFLKCIACPQLSVQLCWASKPYR